MKHNEARQLRKRTFSSFARDGCQLRIFAGTRSRNPDFLAVRTPTEATNRTPPSGQQFWLFGSIDCLEIVVANFGVVVEKRNRSIMGIDAQTTIFGSRFQLMKHVADWIFKAVAVVDSTSNCDGVSIRSPFGIVYIVEYRARGSTAEA